MKAIMTKTWKVKEKFLHERMSMMKVGGEPRSEHRVILQDFAVLRTGSFPEMELEVPKSFFDSVKVGGEVQMVLEVLE